MMLRTHRSIAYLIVCISVAACGSDSPTTPTPTPTPTPTVTLYTVTGIVSNAAGGVVTEGEVRVLDGPSAGRTSGLDGSGRYRLENLSFAGFSIGITAPGFVGQSRGISLTSGQQTFTANFTLLPAVPYTRTGTGNDVFTIPSYFSRVRIIGIFTGRSTNFIVRIGGRLVVNELLGTSWGPTVYNGVHTNQGGAVEITNSAGVAWSFTEER